MAVNFKKAAKGDAASIEEIYGSFGGRFSALAELLCQNGPAAQKAAVAVWEKLMKGIKDGSVASPEVLLYEGTKELVSACRALVSRSNPKAFSKGSLQETDEAAEPSGSLFPGDPVQGLASFSKALRALDPLQRFTAVLKTLGLGSAKTAELMGLSEGEANSVYAQSLPLLENALKAQAAKEYSINIPRADQLADLLERGLKAAVPSTGSDRSVRVLLRSFEVEKPKWQRYLPVAAIVLCLCGVIAGVMATLNKGDESQDLASLANVSPDSAIIATIEVEDYGTITAKLDASAAPLTVANFMKLAQEGFYDGLTFHRIMEGFMIQGGDPDGNGSGGSDENIKGEFSSNGVENNNSHTRGAISMARNSFDMDSASSQFFIVQNDSTFLDGDYACFGYVTEGMEVVDAIAADAEPIDDNGTIPKDQQPVIKSITVSMQ